MHEHPHHGALHAHRGDAEQRRRDDLEGELGANGEPEVAAARDLEVVVGEPDGAEAHGDE